jgi:uncharacterized membrane protein
MSWYPQIPDWDGVHPALVHFPIALLLAAPVLLLIGLFTPKSWRAWSLAALVTMTLGTVAAWLAVSAGHAAGQLVDKVAGLSPAIARHEALGVTTRNLFTILTVVLLGLLAVPELMKRALPPVARYAAFAVFLIAYVASTGVLAQAANQGGRLVHELGVRAVVTAPASSSATNGNEATTAAR